jgi:hypothetical protein
VNDESPAAFLSMGSTCRRIRYRVFSQSQEDFEPELPGCASTGETEEESRQNIEEAIRLYLAPAENRGNDWVSAVRLA